MSAPPVSNSEEDNARRVSWLHSNALEKVTKQNRMSELALDNTIQELNTGKDSDGGGVLKENTKQLEKNVGNKSEFSRPPIKSAFAAHTSTDSVSRSFLDETNLDISLINTEAHPAGVVLQRAR